MRKAAHQPPYAEALHHGVIMRDGAGHAVTNARQLSRGQSARLKPSQFPSRF
jgi:hypothetical protein